MNHKDFGNGLHGFGDIAELEEIMAEMKTEGKKTRDAWKDYKPTIPTSYNKNFKNGVTIYYLNGYSIGSAMGGQNFMAMLGGAPAPAPNPSCGQYYILNEMKKAEMKTYKNGTTRLKMSHKVTTELIKSKGKDAFGPMYPGGPNEPNIHFGSQDYKPEDYNKTWFTDKTLAMNAFNDCINKGFEYKF